MSQAYVRYPGRNGDAIAYEWADDCSLSDDELLADVHVDVPVEINLVPCARLLRGLTERMPFAVAFDGWIRAVLGVHDAEREAEALERAVDSIPFESNENEPYERRLSATQREAMFGPLIDAGLTLRQMASRLDLPLALVVCHSWAHSAATHAEQLADLEDALIADGCPSNASELARKYGLRHETIKRLCERHAIVYRAGAVPHRKYVQRGTYTDEHKREYLRLRSEGMPGAQCIERMGLPSGALDYFRRIPRLVGSQPTPPFSSQTVTPLTRANEEGNAA